MTQGFRIVYSPEAEHDLELIDGFIAEYAGVAAADRVLDSIRMAVSKLADFPNKGTVRHDIIPGLRAIPAAEKAVICLIVDDNTHTIKIVCVTYAGQDWQTIAKDRK